MADIEKVLQGLKCHKSGCCAITKETCPYWSDSDCIKKLCSDASELLRVKVIRCKDCRHGDICTISRDGEQYVECHAHEEEGYDKEPWKPLDWYCADAELKINAEE